MTTFCLDECFHHGWHAFIIVIQLLHGLVNEVGHNWNGNKLHCLQICHYAKMYHLKPTIWYWWCQLLTLCNGDQEWVINPPNKSSNLIWGVRHGNGPIHASNLCNLVCHRALGRIGKCTDKQTKAWVLQPMPMNIATQCVHIDCSNNFDFLRKGCPP